MVIANNFIASFHCRWFPKTHTRLTTLKIPCFYISLYKSTRLQCCEYLPSETYENLFENIFNDSYLMFVTPPSTPRLNKECLDLFLLCPVYTVCCCFLIVHVSQTLFLCFHAGVQVDLPVFLPGCACIAAAGCATLPAWESSIPADGEEGWSFSWKRYCRHQKHRMLLIFIVFRLWLVIHIQKFKNIYPGQKWETSSRWAIHTEYQDFIIVNILRPDWDMTQKEEIYLT